MLHKTHYGLTIYAHVLQEYYPGETVLSLSGKGCRPAKNPFNHNKPTLDIFWCNNLFRFKDDQLSDFAGDPFDFAELHYELHGDELLQQLNEAMNLGCGDFQSPVKHSQSLNTATDLNVTAQAPEESQPVSIPSFSLFLHPVSNIQPFQTINLREAWNLIRSPYYREQTHRLRQLRSPLPSGEGKGVGLARKYKATQFDYATFSGVFSKRNDQALVQHSGLLTIDFDHIPDLGELKLALIADPCLETGLMFISPSGDGLKWVIPIDLNECSHQEWFRAVESYIRATYRLEIDKSGKDISRACFLPYDPEAYLNPLYQVPASSTTKSRNHEAK